MKRILGIISGIIYLFSANALIHASTMGFFEEQQTTTHCHQAHDTTTDKDNKNQNDVDCCELIYSNQYTQSQPQIKTLVKYFASITPVIDSTIYFNKTTSLHTTPINSPPGRKTDNKFNNFSDLAGIIVNII